MTVDLTIRSATPGDAEGIARVHVDSWCAGYRGLLADELLAGLSIDERTSIWRERLTGKDAQHTERQVSVAVVRDVIVGFVAAGASDEQEGETRVGEIYALYVHPDSWSQGVGRALMQSAVDHPVARGSTEALLWVLASNARARRFYERAGWAWNGRTRTQRLPGVPDFDGEVEEACYRRWLP